MYIELIKKTIYWYGSKGVVLLIRASMTTDTGKRVLDIEVAGTDEARITMTIGDKHFTIPNTIIHEWLKVEGYIWEWEKETTKYRAALSKVDLPYMPRYVKQPHLSYRLSVGDNVYLVLDVHYGPSRLDVYVGWNEDDGYLIGTYIIMGVINMDTVRVAFESVVNKHTESLRDGMILEAL